MTVADRRTLDALEAFQQPEVPIRVSRLIGISPADADAALVVPPRTGERADDGTDAAVSR
jgi:hypothetical protein